jgi:formylglycine-generating enzyme required for sulfatase activity
VIPEPTLVTYRPELVLVPAGKFVMGSTAAERKLFDKKDAAATGRATTEDENKNGHEAEVASFYICQTEVTRAQWRAVMKDLPPCRHDCMDEYPVSNMDWEDACDYLNALTRIENESRLLRGAPVLSECYTTVSSSITWSDPACTGYRLPTETEWEYVARAGTTTAFSFGNEPTEACRYANGADRSLSTSDPAWTNTLDCDDGFPGPAPVASLLPNAWGLYDVHGNLHEWVWGRYHHEPAPKEGSLGYYWPDLGVERALRGGSYESGPKGLRSADRFMAQPTLRRASFGLRCARSAPPE